MHSLVAIVPPISRNDYLYSTWLIHILCLVRLQQWTLLRPAAPPDSEPFLCCDHCMQCMSSPWHGAWILLILDEMLKTGVLNECVKIRSTLIRQVMWLYILTILNKNSKCTTVIKHMSTKENIIYSHKEWITCSCKEKDLCKICLIKRIKSMY